MSKSSLRYRAAQRRALKSIALTRKPVIKTNLQAHQITNWQQATYVRFNPASGQHIVRNLTGETSQATRIPGYGAEFGGVSTGSSGLLSQGFWSN